MMTVPFFCPESVLLPRNQNLRSIYVMLVAVAMFSLMDTAMKLLSAHYPAMQVTALRALSSLPPQQLRHAQRHQRIHSTADGIMPCGITCAFPVRVQTVPVQMVGLAWASST